MREHTPIAVTGFNGVYDRGQDDSCPQDHFIDAKNVRFDVSEVYTREGLSLSLTIPNIRRTHSYKRMGEVPRLLILNSSGSIYDSTNLASPIITIAGMTDFSCLTFYNRAYIAPHNGVTGLPGEFLYVYDGSTIRKAAGLRPSGSSMVATQGTSGRIEPGTHIIAVAYETASGFITKPGPTLYTVYVAPDDGSLNPPTYKVDMSGIPTGPSGTTKRYLLSTKSVEANSGGDAYDGNQEGYEFFFVPDGVINNNVDTTLTLDFYDADLIQSADYLFDQLEEIPAPIFITQYAGRMVVGGADTAESVVRISKKNDPESYDAVEGFVTVDPSESGSVRVATEFRNALYMFKSLRAYVTQDNLSTEPVFWEVITIDKGVGSEVFGISTILDAKGTSTDRFVLADRSGLLVFDGYFNRPELTFKVEGIWNRINKEVFSKIQVLNDPVTQSLYILLPLDGATSPSHVLYGDYSLGLNPTTIKWCLWSFPVAMVSGVVDVETNGNTYLRVAGFSGNVYNLSGSLNDDGTAIESYVKTAYLKLNNVDVHHFNELSLRVKGSGNLVITLYGLDDVNTKVLSDLPLSSAPGKLKHKWINFVNEAISIKLSVSAFNEWFNCAGLNVFGIEQWKNRRG